jgi:hypothetical protein
MMAPDDFGSREPTLQDQDILALRLHANFVECLWNVVLSPAPVEMIANSQDSSPAWTLVDIQIRALTMRLLGPPKQIQCAQPCNKAPTAPTTMTPVAVLHNAPPPRAKSEIDPVCVCGGICPCLTYVLSALSS